MNFNDYLNYEKLETPIQLEGFKIVGHFPYSTACVMPDAPNFRNKMPREVASNIEDNFPRKDNKIVIICEDTTRFGTNDFAVFLHDSGCVFGRYEEVRNYGGNKLKKK